MRLALILLLLAPAAVAQEAEVNAAELRACFDAARAQQGRASCVGEAARSCQARPGGQTTLGITECLLAETQAWQALMHESLTAKAEALGRINADLVAQLHQTQAAWSAYRDAECGLRYGVWIEGSIRTIIAADCHLQKTAARAVEVARLGEME